MNEDSLHAKCYQDCKFCQEDFGLPFSTKSSTPALEGIPYIVGAFRLLKVKVACQPHNRRHRPHFFNEWFAYHSFLSLCIIR